MSSDFIEDRGPAEYFHGRQEIIDTFTSALKRYLSKKRGTTFLIQGAPGAGKTALLHECKKIVKKKWQIADIYPNALWSPEDLSHCLGKKSGMRITGASAEVGVEKIIKASAGFSVEASPVALTIMKILQDDKNPLLLILDEAQSLGSDRVVPDGVRGVVTSVLGKIHNGDLGRPVMLLTAGLGTTVSAFKSFNISRFEGESLINLGRLDKDSEHEVIRDWLTEVGAAEGNPDPWIDVIAKETHGWPQHIISYVKPAVGYLKSNNHQMTDAGLRIVLEKGAESRLRYYRQRAHDIDGEQRQSLARSLAHLPIGGTTTRTSIISILEEEYPPEVADNLFKQALEQGIIDKNEDGYYGVPIPSMQTWLIEAYGRKQVDMPKIEDELSKVRRELPKQEKDSSKWSREQ